MKKKHLLALIFLTLITSGLSCMQYGYETEKNPVIATEVTLYNKNKREYYSINWRNNYLKNPLILYPYLFIAMKKKRDIPYNTIAIWDIRKIKNIKYTTWLLYGYKPEKNLIFTQKKKDNIYNTNIDSFTISNSYEHLIIKTWKKKQVQEKIKLPEKIHQDIKKYQAKKCFYYIK